MIVVGRVLHSLSGITDPDDYITNVVIARETEEAKSVTERGWSVLQ